MKMGLKRISFPLISYCRVLEFISLNDDSWCHKVHVIDEGFGVSLEFHKNSQYLFYTLYKTKKESRSHTNTIYSYFNSNRFLYISCMAPYPKRDYLQLEYKLKFSLATFFSVILRE